MTDLIVGVDAPADEFEAGAAEPQLPRAQRWRRSAAEIGSRRTRAVASIGMLLGVQALLMVPHPGTHFWIDEALSVGIGRVPLRHIPSALRLDGNPPLWYVLVHFWLPVAGRSEAALHALSMAFAFACTPVAFAFGDRLFGRRTAWMAGLLVAANPFIVAYGREFRMYSLVTLLCLTASGSFALAFVRRLRRWLVAFSASLVLLLYTHTWSVFYVAGTLVAWGICIVWSTDRRALVTDGLLAYGAALVCWLPWIPELLYQARHTGAPWSKVPDLRDALRTVPGVFGDPRAALILVAGGLAAVMVAVRRRATFGDRSITVLVVIVVVALFVAWAANRISPAWTLRYLSILVGTVLLLAGAALARARGSGTVALLLVAMLWVDPVGRALRWHPAERASAKSPAADIAQHVRGYVHPGDLVISTQVEQVPPLDFYLPHGLSYFTPAGPVADPGIVDWRDVTSRVQHGPDLDAVLRVVRQLPSGSRVLVVFPPPTPVNHHQPVWFQLIAERTDSWVPAIQSDADLRDGFLVWTGGGLTGWLATRS